MLTITEVERPAEISHESATLDIEALFKEAKLRERRRRLKWLGLSLSVAAVSFVILASTFGVFGSSPSHSGAVTPGVATLRSADILSCSGTPVNKPSAFVISCADANAALTKTHWSSWTATRAVGTTTFALNLCTPYCAASPMSYFSNSTVHLSKPVATKNGRLFSTLVVDYTHHGKVQQFAFSWKGDRSF